MQPHQTKDKQCDRCGNPCKRQSKYCIKCRQEVDKILSKKSNDDRKGLSNLSLS